MSNLSGFVKRIRDIMRNDAGINGDAQRIEQMAWMLFLKVYDAKEEDWEFEDSNYKSIIPEECRWRNWAKDDKSGSSMTGEKLLNFVNNKLFPTLKTLEITPQTPMSKAIVKTTFEDANNYMKDGVQLKQVLNEIDELEAEYDQMDNMQEYDDSFEERVYVLKQMYIRQNKLEKSKKKTIILFNLCGIAFIILGFAGIF